MRIDFLQKEKIGRRLRDIVIGVVLGYIVLILLMFTTQRALQYNPDRTMMASPAQTRVPQMTPVFISTEDGFKNQSWLYQPRNDDPKIIVFFHGNASDLAGRDVKARALIDAGYGVMLVGYRGYENNPGVPSQTGLFADARAAVRFLHETQGIPFDHMVFYGESLGSGVATQMASEFPDIAALVYEVPFDSALSVAEKRYPFIMGLPYLMKDPYRNDLLVPSLVMPKLIVAAGKDHVVPPAHARRLFDLAAGPKEFALIDQAGHLNVYDYGAAEKIAHFLKHVFARRTIAPVPNQTTGKDSRDKGQIPKGDEKGGLDPAPSVFPLPIHRAYGVPLVLMVEVARTEKELALGLMNRPSLPEGNGMLFLFPQPDVVGFWMKETLIPLDILFIDGQGRVVKIYAHARPLDETVISSGVPVVAAVEIAGGSAEKYGLELGDIVDLSGF